MEENEYAEDIRIDEEMLDWEWIDQPNRMLKYCNVLAKTLRDLDLAKEDLDVVKAGLDKDIRSDPEKFGITGKITEALLDNTITLQADFIAANHKYIECKYEAEMAKSAVRAMDQRKDALENLVRLHGQSYFAGPRTPHDLTSTKPQWRKEYNPKISTKGNGFVRRNH